MIEVWNFLEFDFARVLHLDLELLLPRKSWRWFTVRASGLLEESSTLIHAYARKKADDG